MSASSVQLRAARKMRESLNGNVRWAFFVYLIKGFVDVSMDYWEIFKKRFKILLKNSLLGFKFYLIA